MTELLLQSPFTEMAALLVLAATVGFAGMLLRQPLIVSFIAVGLIAGPGMLDIVRSSEQIELLSELGIAVLLFLVGIKLDVKLIRSLGAVSLMTGLGQVLFTSVIGYVLGLTLGLGAIASLYVAVALTFSSTIIIVKLLSDKREIDSLHGQIAVGLLIVQDLVVVLAMIVLSSIGIGSAEGAGGKDIVAVILAGAGLLAAVVIFVRFIAEPLTARLARAPELLICFAVAQTALFAALGEALGFGKELGGLLAGVSLASTRYREAIGARLAPLRDFLLLFFFVGLGSGIELSTLGEHGLIAVVLSLFVLAGKPLIMLIIMSAMGYDRRTGFLAGLTVAQISEFSLILVAMGVGLGHIGADVLGLVTLVGLITIAASSYMITYSHALYERCEPALGIFSRIAAARRSVAGASRAHLPDVLIFGLGRFGGAVAARLRARGARVLGIDFNPAVVQHWRELGFEAEYGDASDGDFIAGLPLEGVRWAVATVPPHSIGVTHDDPRLAITQALRGAGFSGRIAVATNHPSDAEKLRAAGVDLVLEPFEDAADQAVDLLASGTVPVRVRSDAASPQPVAS